MQVECELRDGGLVLKFSPLGADVSDIKTMEMDLGHTEWYCFKELPAWLEAKEVEKARELSINVDKGELWFSLVPLADDRYEFGHHQRNLYGRGEAARDVVILTKEERLALASALSTALTIAEREENE